MSSLLHTLLRPDDDEDPERGEVIKAANLLQIGEFQLLQLAYHGWHGKELEGRLSDQIFRAYMVHSRVPIWARHYARQIIERAEQGALDDWDPDYHRYDCEYYKALPLGARRLTIAVLCIGFVLVGGLLVGRLAALPVTSVLPPYFNEEELAPRGGGQQHDS